MDATVRSCDREAGESRQQVQVALTPPTIIWMRTIYETDLGRVENRFSTRNEIQKIIS